jgi:GGDEF domain-containing protein
MADFNVKVHEEPLLKVEPALAGHLAALRAANPESANFLARKLFTDAMVPGVGNKLAFEDFASRPRKGVSAMIDLNDFGQINKLHGQSTGDDALKAAFGAISRASRANKGKFFRVGGDEGRLFFSNPEQAYSFARLARQELEALPPVKGTHFHSASIGFGHSPEHAEMALIHAKNAKKAANYLPGQAKTHAHSLLTGAVGAVPVDKEPDGLPPGLTPIQPGTAPMPTPNADAPWLAKSEESLALVHDNPSQPIPVYFLANGDGLSPDGAAFLKVEQLLKHYGDLAEPRRYGFVLSTALAKHILLSDAGWVLFER